MTDFKKLFDISVFVITGVFLIYGVANTLYYYRIRKGPCPIVSITEATIFMAISIIISLVSLGIMIWSLLRILRKREPVASVTSIDTVERPNKKVTPPVPPEASPEKEKPIKAQMTIPPIELVPNSKNPQSITPTINISYTYPSA